MTFTFTKEADVKPGTRPNANRHPSLFWEEQSCWIDEEIIPLIPVFNTRRFFTGATCQGNKEIRPNEICVTCGEFAIHGHAQTTDEDMISLVFGIRERFKGVSVFNQAIWGVWIHVGVSRSSTYIEILFENQYLPEIVAALRDFDPESVG